MKKLIYVYGVGRSGTTLIGQVLGSPSGIRCVGEFAGFTTLDDLSRPEDEKAEDVRDLPCGCGRNPMECEENALNLYLKKFSLFKVRKWFSNKSFRLPPEYTVAEYLKSIKCIYDHFDEEIIIDTSKNPKLYYMMKRSPVFKDYEVNGVFIYRDLREVWKSWRKEKSYLKQKSRLSTLKHMTGQLFWCTAVYLSFSRTDLFINFNSFRKNPVKYFELFNDQLGLDIVYSDREIHVNGQNHEVAGNPSKLEGGQKIIVT